jgi:hypothetical protein
MQVVKEKLQKEPLILFIRNVDPNFGDVKKMQIAQLYCQTKRYQHTSCNSSICDDFHKEEHEIHD